MNARTGSGGAATQAGIIYQNRVAAWFATRILAERDASPPLGLPADISLEFLRCETEQPVDDLMIGTSAGGHLFIQVKHSLSLEVAENSALSSSIHQFVRQFSAYRGVVNGKRSWERALDPNRDRLVIVTSSRSSAPIRRHLTSVLSRLRSLTPQQMIDDAAITGPETSALGIVRTHLTRIWRNEMGSDPSDQEVREILSLLWIQTLDVDEGGDGEREAKDILRSIVLEDAERADNAWASLVEACGLYATRHDGANRSGLHQALLRAGIGLKAPRSYRNDIEKLSRHSESVMDATADLSRIRVGVEREVKINRRSTQALREAAERDSLVVVGEPGAGKSGAIHDFVETLHDDGRDVIYFAVDRLEANSLGLLRDELGLTHEINDILGNWPGEHTGFLVIDALDAARSDRTSQTLRNLLADTLDQRSRWKVVVSIRKFDLRYDQLLRKLFRGRPPKEEFQDQEFGDIRHLHVPLLSPEELDNACEQSQSLFELFNSLTPDQHPTLRQLLKNPFNLRLVGELLDAGVETEALTPIRTQIDLLDKYWNERVIGNDRQGDSREAVVRRAVEKMVETRSLRVDRDQVTNETAGEHMMKLLSAHLLVEWQSSPSGLPNRHILAFAHHILFDYAVASLLLRGDVLGVIARLEQDTELVVVIRPSLILHFQHEWWAESDRRSFWDLVFRVIDSPRIPMVGKVIGPSVAAELTGNLSDCQPLIERLEDADPAARLSAEQALRHLARSLLVARGNLSRPLIGDQAPPWCELLERSTRHNSQYAVDALPLVMEIYDHPELLTTEQLGFMGQVARRLLEFAWGRIPPAQTLVTQGLLAVARTFGSDVTASAALLRTCLEPSHLANYGYLEMPQLAAEIDWLIVADPALVEDIYRAAFTHREESTEATAMGGSPTVSFTSNRSQDYSHALLRLAGRYRKFLEHAPTHATRALIVAVEDYVTRRHSQSSPSEETESRFYFNDIETIIKTDYSDIWDSGSSSRDDEPLRMLDTFTEYLMQLGDAAERMALIRIIATQNRYAVFWRRLLECGADVPETIGVEIRPVGWAAPILTGYDTTHMVGNYLEKVFSFINAEDRQRIEQAILFIPETIEHVIGETAEHTRDRLLGCLPFELLVTQEAKDRIRQLKAEGGAPSNEPFRHVTGGVWSRPSNEDFLARQGVPVDTESYKRMDENIRPVEEFSQGRRNTAPSGPEVDEVLPHIYALREAIAHADEEGVHPKQRDYAWGTVITAGAVIAKMEKLSCSGERGALVREILIEGTRHPDPVHHPENDARFDEHQGWSTPAPRVDTAEGLLLLAREASCADPQVLNAIRQLSRDNVPAVRFQVARYLHLLYYTAPDVMWDMIEQIIRVEMSRGVLQALLRQPLSRLAGPHADRVTDLVRIIFNSITDGSGSKEVRKLCTDIFTNLYLWKDQPLAREIIFEIADGPSQYTNEAYEIAFLLRNPLTQGSAESPKVDQDAIRSRAWGLIDRIVSKTTERFNQLIEQYPDDIPLASWPVQEREEAKRLAELAEGLATELYFASGAFDGQMGDSGDSKPPLGGPEKRRFLQDAGPLLDRLAELGLPGIAHHLVQTLEYLIDFDPASVFLKISRIIRASRNSRYQYDPVAMDLIVTLVSRFLATYPQVLRERQECRQALIEILNVFVEVGWPTALRLAYRIEEIYR